MHDNEHETRSRTAISVAIISGAFALVGTIVAVFGPSLVDKIWPKEPTATAIVIPAPTTQISQEPPTLAPVQTSPAPTANAQMALAVADAPDNTEKTPETQNLRSCQEIQDAGLSNGDDFYTIDADGVEGRLEPFEVYCDMTRQGGGWTLFAYHTDGIKVFEIDRVTRSEPGVMQSERWRAVRANMTTGMLFVDENGKVSMLSAAKLNRGNCQTVQNPESLVPASASSHIWHDEDAGCNGTGQDYSLINLQGPSYANYKTNGASLYQWSAEKFDIWPYRATASYDEQHELSYFIK